MTAPNTISFENDPAFAAFAVDGVREGVEAGGITGIYPDDPMVAALFEVLERVDWPASGQTLLQALPHAPESFSLYDLQSTLSRVGIRSTVSRLGRRSISEIRAPAVMIERSGRVGILVEDAGGARRLVNPVDRSPLSRRPAAATTVVTFNKSRQQGGNWFVFDLLNRSRRLIASLLAVKLVINLVTVLTALSVFAIFDKVVSIGATETLKAIGVGMAAVLAVDFLYRFAKARMLARVSARLEYLISSLAFRRVLSMPLEKLIAGTVAQQLARLRPLNAMASSVVVPLLDALSDIPFALLLTILLFFLAGPIGFLPIALFAVFAAAFALMMPGIRRLEDEARQSAEVHAQIMSDLVAHADEIRLSYDKKTWMARAMRAARLKASRQRKAELASRNLALIGTLATPVVGGGTAIAGAALAMNGNLTIGGLIAAMILSWRIIAPMQGLLLLVSKWSDMFRLSAQLNRLMTMPVETDQQDNAARPLLRGKLELSGVAYRFGGSGELALRNVTVTIPAGAFVAVTGSSGAGKTTFLRMLPALIQPLAGTIRIDGINVRQIPLDHLRACVSYVPCKPVPVHGTIGQNMRLSSPLVSDEEVKRVLKEVGLSEVVRSLPYGIGTRMTADFQAIMPKGFGQALALAQALINRPKVLLLDEPARSLDPLLEKAMMDALLARRGEMTIVMVTHRPSHIRFADFELQLEAGQVRSFRSSQRKAS